VYEIGGVLKNLVMSLHHDISSLDEHRALASVIPKSSKKKVPLVDVAFIAFNKTLGLGIRRTTFSRCSLTMKLIYTVLTGKPQLTLASHYPSMSCEMPTH
jgi:hypothetical protein